MDEKEPLLPVNNRAHDDPSRTPAPPVSDEQPPTFRIVRFYRVDLVREYSRLVITSLFLRLFLLCSLFLIFFNIFRMHHQRNHPVPNIPYGAKVPLEAHIMSKCPDAKDCLKKLVVPTMQEVGDMVDFRLSYIANVGGDDTDIECKHGPEECLGNIIELCAAELYPDPKISLGFTMCMTEDYESIPQKELVKGCALEHGMDFNKLNECMSRDDGAFGSELLRKSALGTIDANVTYSCTIRLDNEVRCIRDGGEWKDCPGGSKVRDLVEDIKSLRPS